MRTYTCTPGVSFRQAKAINIEYAKWINGMDWSFYCTFTTKYTLSIKAARRAMERLYSFVKKRNAEVKLFWVAEPFEAFGYHLHALIDINTTALNIIECLKKAWQIVSKGSGGKGYNNTVIKPFDKKLGGAHYVSKYLMKANADYDILIN
jgi:hypothetical protein